MNVLSLSHCYRCGFMILVCLCFHLPFTNAVHDYSVSSSSCQIGYLVDFYPHLAFLTQDDPAYISNSSIQPLIIFGCLPNDGALFSCFQM